MDRMHSTLLLFENKQLKECEMEYGTLCVNFFINIKLI